MVKGEWLMVNQVVIFCMYRSSRGAGGVICPGGIWTCTNPTGHCSCVSTCGIKRREHSAEGIDQEVNYESDKGQRREIHLLPS